MNDVLYRFLMYNLEMVAKARDKDLADQDHYRNEVWLRARVPARPHGPEESWVGGDPKLPDPFQWPSRDGQPYQFLCQINCATLPKELWGGLGPRTGWLAFFAAITGRYDLKVIYAQQLGPERKCENAWHKSRSTLHHLDDAYDSILLPRPRWTLEFVATAAGEKNPPDLRKRPFQGKLDRGSETPAQKLADARTARACGTFRATQIGSKLHRQYAGTLGAHGRPIR